MPGQARVVAIDLAAIPARVCHPLAIQITQCACIWKTKEHGNIWLESIACEAVTLPREFVHSVRRRVDSSTMSRGLVGSTRLSVVV